MFVNGHGGNVGALAGAAALLRYEGRDVGWCPCGVETPTHTPGTPKRLYCYIFRRKSCGSMSESPGNRAPLAELMPAMRSGGVAAVSELGVLGDPTTATADDGARLFAEMVDGAVGRIARWAPDRDGMLHMSQPRLPDGFAVQVDRRVKVLGEGAALLGGSPTRLLRLAPAAQTMLDGGRLEVHDAPAHSWRARCWTPPSRIRGRRAGRRTVTSPSLFRCGTTYLESIGWCPRCAECASSWSTTARPLPIQRG